VTAGTAGQERGETDDDFGWAMGRIQSSGKIPAAGLVTDLEWVVVECAVWPPKLRETSCACLSGKGQPRTYHSILRPSRMDRIPAC